MIISILAPKGGVGSSTLAVLTAVCKAQTARVLVIDAAPDPSLDLYTSTENQVAEAFNGRLSDSALPVRDQSDLWTARVEAALLPDKRALSEQLLEGGYSEVIIDFGVVSPEDLPKVIQISDEILVVLTQDNQVLRRADHLLAQIRRQGGRAGFIISRLETRDNRELGDADEIYGLLEEDCYGSVRYEHSLRYIMNQGKPTEVSLELAHEIQAVCDKIYHVPVTRGDEYMEEEPDEEQDELKGETLSLTTGQAAFTEESQGSDSLAPLSPESLDGSGEALEQKGIFDRIRSFLKIGKG